MARRPRHPTKAKRLAPWVTSASQAESVLCSWSIERSSTILPKISWRLPAGLFASNTSSASHAVIVARCDTTSLIRHEPYATGRWPAGQNRPGDQSRFSIRIPERSDCSDPGSIPRGRIGLRRGALPRNDAISCRFSLAPRGITHRFRGNCRSYWVASRRSLRTEQNVRGPAGAGNRGHIAPWHQHQPMTN